MQGGRKKVAISYQYLAIARKQLKIDGYMLLCIWPALNPLSIHVTFTVIIIIVIIVIIIIINNEKIRVTLCENAAGHFT